MKGNTMARERLLVMNGTRILQSEGEGGAWQNAKVTPETGQHLKPGFYNLFAAQRADDANGIYQGQVVHADKDKVIQQVGKQLVSHDASNFEGKAVVGKLYTVAYTKGSATVSEGVSQTRPVAQMEISSVH